MSQIQNKNLRDLAETQWVTAVSTPSMEEVKLGVLLNIADSLKRMTAKYDAMESSLKWYEEKYNQHRKELSHKDNQIRSLKGHITRLKRVNG